MTRNGWVKAALYASLFFGIGQTAEAAPATETPSCATDGTIDVCVVSAALSEADSPVFVDVFISLRITNTSRDPLLASIGNDMSFSSENTPSVTPANSSYIRMSGMTLCFNACQHDSSPRFTTFTPGRPLLVQIRYPANVSDDGKRMLQLATTASFTATLGVNDGGRRKLIPLPSTQFKFGNGLAKH